MPNSTNMSKPKQHDIEGGYIRRQQSQLVEHLNAEYLVFRDRYYTLTVKTRIMDPKEPFSVLLSANIFPA